MRRYLSKTPRKEYPSGVRLVHNFYPGPPNDPGQDRIVGLDGFRIWITDEPIEPKYERRCYCGWLDDREHYGTVEVIEQQNHGTPRARSARQPWTAWKVRQQDTGRLRRQRERRR